MSMIKHIYFIYYLVTWACSFDVLVMYSWYKKFFYHIDNYNKKNDLQHTVMFILIFRHINTSKNIIALTPDMRSMQTGFQKPTSNFVYLNPY